MRKPIAIRAGVGADLSPRMIEFCQWAYGACDSLAMVGDVGALVMRMSNGELSRYPSAWTKLGCKLKNERRFDWVWDYVDPDLWPASVKEWKKVPYEHS